MFFFCLFSDFQKKSFNVLQVVDEEQIKESILLCVFKT